MAAGNWPYIWIGIAIVAVYELHFRAGAQHSPLRYARATHARLRAAWVVSLMQERGHELLAVQTLRNSVMSATVTASTAMLALAAVVTLPGLRPGAGEVAATFLRLTPSALLLTLLVVVLCTAFAFSAMALRFFHHAGYLMTTQADGETRERLTHMACNYVMRAGNYYSLGLRTLFWLAPVAVGLLSVRLMPLLAGVTVGVLVWFDRPPDRLEGALPEKEGP